MTLTGHYARGASIDLSRTPGACGFCSGQFQAVIHTGPCPRVEEIEYHPNGTIKRIRYRDDRPVADGTRGMERGR